METIICPHCGKEHDAGTRFCPNTGLSIAVPTSCQSCGEPVEAGWQRCAHCGQTLDTNVEAARIGSKNDQPLTLKPLSLFGVATLLLVVLTLFGILIFRGIQEIPSPSNGPRAGNASQTESGLQPTNTDLPAQGNIPFGESARETLPSSKTAFVGPWEIAMTDSGLIPDYQGQLPAEGHRFHRISLLVLNTSETPLLLTSATLGTFQIEWESYTYYAQAVDTLKGYIPPGWPTSVQVIFNLPVALDTAKFSLRPGFGLGDSQQTISLDGLGSSLIYDPPTILEMGQEFTVPDQISMIPSQARAVRIESGDFTDHYLLLLDATVKNLYGYDLQVGNAPLIFQLFDAGNIWPVTTNLNYYYLPAGSPDFSYRWFAPSPSTGIDPFGMSTDNVALAPGFSREGSFWLNIWGPTTPSTNMLLLVMYGFTGGYSTGPSRWALYQLDRSAASLIQSPLTSIDPAQIKLDQAREAIDGGNWPVAATLLGAVLKAHPGDVEVASQIEEAQKSAGSLIFRQDFRTDFGTGYRLYLRNFGDPDSLAHAIFETPSQIEITQGSAVSSSNNGTIEVSYMSKEGNQLTVHPNEIKSDGEKSVQDIPVVLSDKYEGGYWNVNQYAWSITDNADLLFVLDELGAQSMGIITTNMKTAEVQEHGLCDGTGWITSISLSPDAQKIVFVDRSKGKVMLSNIDGTNCIPLLSVPTDWVKWGPLAWSRDGNKIFVVDKKEILIFSSTGELKEKYPFTLGILIDQIAVSPDGRFLAMKGSYYSYSNQLYLYDMQTEQMYEDNASDYELMGWIP